MRYLSLCLPELYHLCSGTSPRFAAAAVSRIPPLRPGRSASYLYEHMHEDVGPLLVGDDDLCRAVGVSALSERVRTYTAPPAVHTPHHTTAHQLLRLPYPEYPCAGARHECPL